MDLDLAAAVDAATKAGMALSPKDENNIIAPTAKFESEDPDFNRYAFSAMSFFVFFYSIVILFL